MQVSKRILPIIVIAQFCCTTLWFASNSVISNIIADFGLAANALGYLTSAIQFGFILGTLTFAILNVSDKFSPSKVFFWSALAGALVNLGIIWQNNSLTTLLLFRFSTGFFLAGIYPVGMKIAADYFEKGLGKSLSFLVGALVLGTAFPHLLSEVANTLNWSVVIVITSTIAVVGGLLVLFLVPDGPYRKISKKIDLTACITIFKEGKFRTAALGYFGHMWELYAFWTFVPIILKKYATIHQYHFNISLLSFLIIGIGGIACVLGGYISVKKGIKKTVQFALWSSGICCLLSGIFFMVNAEVIFIAFLMFWGMVVIMDSPLLSTLVAQNAPAAKKGTALTIVNCLGYSITIISIQLLNTMLNLSDSKNAFVILAIGPLLGIFFLIKNRK